MAHQIIRQPDGLFAIFSTDVDSWIVYDATPDEIIAFYELEASKEARRKATHIIDLVTNGNPELVYYQFALSFDEANAIHNEHADPVPFREA